MLRVGGLRPPGMRATDTGHLEGPIRIACEAGRDRGHRRRLQTGMLLWWPTTHRAVMAGFDEVFAQVLASSPAPTTSGLIAQQQWFARLREPEW